MRVAAPSAARASGLGAAFGVLLAGALFAVLAGAGTALAGPYAAAGFSAILLGIAALFLPLRWLVVALVFVSFVVTGQLIYFARIDKALWFPFLIGALMLVRFPLDRMQRGARATTEGGAIPRTPAAMKVFIALYMATLFASTLINTIGPLQMLVSFKEYLFLWGLYLVLAAGLVKPELVIRIWNLLPWLMLLQLPLIAYQRFVVAPSRINVGAAWDAVVGAFGGNPMAGGSSGAMGLFCVVAMLSVIARWRAGMVPLWQALLLGASGMLGIGLAEIKFAVLMLPIGFVLLYLREFVRRPLRGFAALSLSFVLAGAVLVGYQAQYSRVDKSQSFSEYFESMFSSSTDADFVNLRTREIGRVAALSFWADQHGLDEPMPLFIGHGAGASRVGETVVGEAAKPYPFNISRSALAMLLWETGLIGSAALLGLIAAAFLRLFSQSGDARLDEPTRVTTASMAVAVVVFACGLPYNTDLLFSHQIQVMLMLCMGFAAMTHGRLPSAPVGPRRRSVSPRAAALPLRRHA